MKQFNLEEYLKDPTKKVVTRDGKDVRIICMDRPAKKPIVALVSKEENYSDVRTYFADGRSYLYGKDNDDLFFAPEKKVGWMNLYKRYFGLVKGGEVYNSEEAAKKMAAGDEDYIITIKIEWEE